MTTAIFQGYRLLTFDSGLYQAAFPRLTIVSVYEIPVDGNLGGDPVKFFERGPVARSNPLKSVVLSSD